MTVAELAERVGVTRVTIRKIEQGNPTVGIGVVFEAATVLDVALFVDDRARFELEKRQLAADLALLPERVRKPTIDDDF